MDRQDLAAPPRKGRGASFNPKVRFESRQLDPFDDGWGSLGAARDEAPPPPTEVLPDASRTVIARNSSPDIPFDRSINPYRGCEHGCIYCYARPSHAYLGLSPGLDFETKLLAKLDAAPLLERELAPARLSLPADRAGHQHRPLPAAGAPSQDHPRDPRGAGAMPPSGHHRHQVGGGDSAISTCWRRWPRDGLARVALSVTTLDPALARTLEPRAAAPQRRLEALRDPQRGWGPDQRHGGAGHPGAQRP